MSKKLLFLVAGALTALAFTALPGIASAKETKTKCEGAGACTFTVSGGVSNLSLVGGDTLQCSGVTGAGEVTGLNAERESSTSNVQYLFTGCKEQNTIFKFNCQNTATKGNITTNVVVSHNIALPGTTNEAGVLLANWGVTMTCAGGFASTQITGSIVGESKTKCNTNTGTLQRQVFSTTGHGAQSLTTYTGSTFKLESKTSHTGGGTYESFAINGTTTRNFNQNVILTCA